MAKVTTRKKKRTTDSRTGCVTTRCCVECPRPTRRRRRRKLASKSLPLSRAMPMPLQSIQNIMPSPFMPLNVPLPRVETNRRPFGTYQFNNQPVRVQQKSTRTIGTITDNMIRGTTSQKLPITNAPSTLPKPRLESPVVRGIVDSLTPKNPFIPNTLDLQGMNALGVSNQGQNLRVNPGVRVAREELISSRSSSGESAPSINPDEFPDEDFNPERFDRPEDFSATRDAFGGNLGGLSEVYESMGMGMVPAVRESRRVLSQQSQSLSQMGGRMTGGTMTMGDLPSSGGAGARIAGDTTNDVSN